MGLTGLRIEPGRPSTRSSRFRILIGWHGGGRWHAVFCRRRLGELVLHWGSQEGRGAWVVCELGLRGGNLEGGVVPLLEVLVQVKQER